MKKYLPHILAVAFFLLLSVLVFLPLFQGKEIKQSDVTTWKGMAQEIVSFKEKTGEDTYWTNSMFSGMPAYQISAVYAANLVQYLDKVVQLGLPTPANMVFLLMAGFYFLLIVLGVNQRLSILGAVAFAFSSYFFIYIEAGHNTKAHAIAYMAPVVAGLLLTFRGRMLLGAAITGLALALELYANHLQITYYLLLTVVLLGIMELYNAFRENRLGYFFKATGILLVAAGLAVGSNITNLWATQEYGKYSTRGKSELTSEKENKTSGLDRDYITDWSFGVGESLSLLVPSIKGGASEPIAKNNKDVLQKVESNFRQYVSGFGAYFGEQPFTSGPVYVGAIICMLFLLGLLTIKGPEKWWLLAAFLLSITLSWGRNFMGLTNFFLDFVPGYDKFRAVTTIIVIAEFAMPLLGILALDKLIREPDYFKQHAKSLYYAIGITLGLTLLIAVAPGMFTSFYSTREYEQVMATAKNQGISQDVVDNIFTNLSTARKAIVTADAWRSFLFLLLGAALIVSFARMRYKAEYFVFGLLALVLVDMWSVNARYLGDDDYVRASKGKAEAYPMTTADQVILQDPAKSYRVLNLAESTFNDASTSYRHQSIGGYHGAKLKRYQELIENELAPELMGMRNALQNQDSSTLSVLTGQPAVNMLNTKYIVYNPDAAPLINTGALGNAWFVQNVELVANADSEIAALRGFDPSRTLVVDQRYADLVKGFTTTPDSGAFIRLTDYQPNHLKYESSASTEQLAVFSEIYYDKGWNATIDGKPADYFRADYVLRAMRIPAGKHTIEFRFEPRAVVVGEKIALASSSLLLLFCAGMGFLALRKRPA